MSKTFLYSGAAEKGKQVFAKIFTQIFDSSIAEDYMVRLVFMDLLVLCDRDGIVDMTPEAISRRTNVPLEGVARALERLSKPDLRSRSHLEDGARIVLLDSHRDWGWQVVNYQHYRSIMDEESRKQYFRDKKRQYRAMSKTVKDKVPMSKMSTQAEVEAEAEAIKVKTVSANADRKTGRRIPADFKVTDKHREWATANEMPDPDSLIDEFRDFWMAKAGQNGTKLDWDATFRTWMRNAKQRQKGNGSGAKKGGFNSVCNEYAAARGKLVDS
ncbi:MAG: hypothetical protein WB870_06670 [Gallionellaceae bacterium]